MTFKTIGQLPRIASDENIPDGSLVEVAVPYDTEKYTSKSITTNGLKEFMLSSFESDLVEKYQMTDGEHGGNPLNLREMNQQISSVISGDGQEFIGNKVFRGDVSYASVRKTSDLDDKSLVAKANVVELAQDSGPFLSPDTTYVNANPHNTTPNTIYDEDSFMKWQFDQDGRDSTQFVLDPYANQKAEPVFAKYSGNLVVYGWLADNGNVAAQEAWVGLFGRVSIGNKASQNKEWVALQIQPWILGQKSQSLQYVGFNVPVKKNMQLKIMTGFPVNVKNSGFQDPSYNTLTLVQNQPCTFVGYILRND